MIFGVILNWVRNMYSILIVEDDVLLGGGVRLFLEKQGYAVSCACSVDEARQALEKPYDLILLDINLPDGSGLELCRQIRETSNIYIIFLTSNDTEQNMIEGFETGCDDYIAKPFSIELLGQRIKAVLRRGTEKKSNVFVYKGLTVDFNKMSVLAENEPVKLSATEFKLLSVLIKNQGQVLTRNVLLEKIWDNDGNFVDENTLSVHIRRLRQKLEVNPQKPQYIITVFGIGYTFGE